MRLSEMTLIDNSPTTCTICDMELVLGIIHCGDEFFIGTICHCGPHGDWEITSYSTRGAATEALALTNNHMLEV